MAEFREALRSRLDQLQLSHLRQVARKAWFGHSHGAPLANCGGYPLLYARTTSTQCHCEVNIMGVALRDVKLADRHVELDWTDGRAGDQFSLLWLKDHCPS